MLGLKRGDALCKCTDTKRLRLVLVIAFLNFAGLLAISVLFVVPLRMERSVAPTSMSRSAIERNPQDSSLMSSTIKPVTYVF